MSKRSIIALLFLFVIGLCSTNKALSQNAGDIQIKKYHFVLRINKEFIAKKYDEIPADLQNVLFDRFKELSDRLSLEKVEVKFSHGDKKEFFVFSYTGEVNPYKVKAAIETENFPIPIIFITYFECEL